MSFSKLKFAPVVLALVCAFAHGAPADAQGESLDSSAAPAAQSNLIDANHGTSGHADFSDNTVPQDLAQRVRVEQKIGAQIPLNLPFVDENGHKVLLGKYFGQKPVLLNLIQLTCDQVCSAELDVMTGSLKQVSFTPGKEFNLLTVSIDPQETPLIAKDAQAERMKAYQRPGAEWHFLTGSQSSIAALAKAVGYHYIVQPGPGRSFIHPDGLMVITSEGKVARYFLNLDYKPQDIRFSLMEASKDRIGTVIEQFALCCFHYNPVTGRYSVQIMNVLKILGLAFVCGCLLTLLMWVLAEKGLGRKRKKTAAVPPGLRKA